MTTGSALVETHDRTWSPVLDGLRVTALDCIQTGLAALIDHAHGEGAHVVLGARPRFLVPPDPGAPAAGAPSNGDGAPVVDAPSAGAGTGTPAAGGPARIEPSSGQRIAEATQLAGLRVARRADGLDGPALRRAAEAADGALYVIADAFAMPWTPYEGRRHMEHSFLLVADDGAFVVIDPYHNDTRWGASRPGVWRLDAADIDAVVERGGAESGAAGVTGAVAPGAIAITHAAGPLPALDAGAVLADTARVLAGARPAMARHVADARAGAGDARVADQLVLDVWLLGRSRLLHAAWLATLPGCPAGVRAAADEHAQEWLRLASQSYVGARRVHRGAELPSAVLDRFAELLAADVDLAARAAAAVAGPADAAGGTGVAGGGDVDGGTGGTGGTGSEATAGQGDAAAVRAVVADAVRVVLRLDEATAGRAQPLRALPGFNSFRLVDIIERVELRLGVHVDGEELTPEALRDVDSLTGMFTRSLDRGGA